MKISRERLKQIIKEEIASIHSAVDPNGTEQIMDHPDDEGDMAKSQMLRAGEYSQKIIQVLDDETQLPSWVQSKLTIAAKNLSSVWHWMDGQVRDPDK